jgi:hypothetical protein
MINVKSKKCLYIDCIKQPCYNYENEKAPLYCSLHKLENMVDIKSKKCLFEGCNILPVYNFEGENIRLYCSKHKLENMINVASKKCIYHECIKQPCYNYESEKLGIYCNLHKLENMINVRDKTCIYEGCKIIPNFNFEDKKKAIYCSNHKLENMINVKDKTCIYEGCLTRPIYNFEGEKIAIYCNEHKLDNMINIRDKTCNSEQCNTLVKNPKYQGYCLYCFVHTFPNEPVSRNYKVKEKHVTDYIKLYFKKYVESYDKKIQGGCSNKRPDIFIDLFTHSIIIEIDENQHFDYSCENKRMMLLFQDLANRPIVFIRFNPDKYIDENGETIKSCFKYHRISGVPMIENEAEWNKRLESLKSTIEKHISTIPQKEVTIEQLYYDKN